MRCQCFLPHWRGASRRSVGAARPGARSSASVDMLAKRVGRPSQAAPLRIIVLLVGSGDCCLPSPDVAGKAKGHAAEEDEAGGLGNGSYRGLSSGEHEIAWVDAVYRFHKSHQAGGGADGVY